MTREEIMNATNEQLNEWTAVKVLGYIKKPYGYVSHVAEEIGESIISVDNWNPAGNFNHSWEVFKALETRSDKKGPEFMSELYKKVFPNARVPREPIELFRKLDGIIICRAALLTLIP
jgi:hypothetical protein